MVWPTVDPAHVGKSGTAWQIFPNFQIGHARNNMLCYSARPYGYDPDKCIFEAAVYELFPKGQEPKTEWEYITRRRRGWRNVLPQDFSNMAAVQQGMKSRGFSGTKPNPYRSAAPPTCIATWRSTWAPARHESSQRKHDRRKQNAPA